MTHFKYHKNATCRICGSSDFFLYLDLGAQPPSNAFIDEFEIPNEQSFPLRVYLCKSCGSSQLLDVVHGETVFDEYLYLSSSSRALREHLRSMIDELLERHRPDRAAVVVDVGANDGITLDCYPKECFKLVGVEPSSVGRYAEEKGHTIIRAFFGRDIGRRLREQHGPVELATATNVCAHVDDIIDFMGGFAEMLSPAGVAVFECSYLPDMIDGGYFDTVYHEHLNYHALTPLVTLFRQSGLRALRAERVAMGASGPAIRVTVGLAEGDGRPDATVQAFLDEEKAWGVSEEAPYRRFEQKVRQAIASLRDTIAAETAAHHRIGAFSAPAKGNTLLNSARLTRAEVEAVAEHNHLKVGKVTPGSHIPIISDSEFLERGFDTALLLAWNYADFFVVNAEFVKRGGRFLVPLPTPELRP